MITPALREALTKQGGAQLRILVLAWHRAVGGGALCGKGPPWGPCGRPKTQTGRPEWLGLKGPLEISQSNSTKAEAPRAGMCLRGFGIAIERDCGPALGSCSRALSLWEEVLPHVEVEFFVV